jgi:hypothetical protein
MGYVDLLFLDGVGICCMHAWDVWLIVEQMTDFCALIRSEELLLLAVHSKG